MVLAGGWAQLPFVDRPTATIRFHSVLGRQVFGEEPVTIGSLTE
jgi:hypothetical protein